MIPRIFCDPFLSVRQNLFNIAVLLAGEPVDFILFLQPASFSILSKDTE